MWKKLVSPAKGVGAALGGAKAGSFEARMPSTAQTLRQPPTGHAPRLVWAVFILTASA